MSVEPPPTPGLGRVFSSLAWMAGATWIQLALSLISFAVITTRLVPSQMGVFGAGILVAGFVSNLFGAPFSDSLQQRSEVTRDHVDSSFWIGVGLASVVAALIAAVAGPLAALLGAPEGGAVMAVLCILMPLNAAAAAPNAVLSRALRFAEVARANTLANMIASAAGIVAIFAGLGVWSLVVAELSRQATRLTAVVLLSGYLPRWPRRFSAFHDLLRFNLGTFGVFLLAQADFVAPRAIVGSLLGVEALGLFVIAERLLELLNQLALAPLGAVTMSSVARFQQHRDRLRQLIRGLYTATPLLACPVFLGAAAVIPSLVELAGPQWVEARAPAQIMLLVGLFATTRAFNIAILRGLGLARAPFILLGAGVALTLAMAPVGALWFGVTGAAVAVLLRAIVIWPLGCGLVTREVELPLRQPLLVTVLPLVAAAIMAVLAMLIQNWLAAEPAAIRLLVAIPTAAAAYAVLLLALSSTIRGLATDGLRGFRTGGPHAAARAVSHRLGLDETA